MDFSNLHMQTHGIHTDTQEHSNNNWLDSTTSKTMGEMTLYNLTTDPCRKYHMKFSLPLKINTTKFTYLKSFLLNMRSKMIEVRSMDSEVRQVCMPNFVSPS